MAIFGALNICGLAMNTHSVHLAQVSMNVANMNTTSYKEVETHYQTIRSRVNQSGDLFSIKPNEIRRVEEQGLVASTGRPLDAAINGLGFFVLNTQADGSGEQRYTRDGSFTGQIYERAGDTNGDGQPDQGTYLITNSGDYVMGWKALEDGEGFETALSAVDYSNDSIDPGKATSEIKLRGNIPATNLTAVTHTLSIPVIRQQTSPEGVPQTVNYSVRLAFVPKTDAPGEWTLTPSVDGVGAVDTITATPADIKFGGDGLLDLANSGDGSTTLALTYADGETQDVSIDLREMTQFSGEEKLALRQLVNDGYGTSVIRGAYFNEEGVVIGRYSNGVEKPLYKLPIATFPAPQNLNLRDGNLYTQAFDSGEPTLRSLTPDDRLSQVIGGSLEYSNVKLEDQFSRMIVTQRAYSSAATVYRTSDEMTKTMRDLI